mgnify:FL=1
MPRRARVYIPGLPCITLSCVVITARPASSSRRITNFILTSGTSCPFIIFVGYMPVIAPSPLSREVTANPEQIVDGAAGGDKSLSLVV